MLPVPGDDLGHRARRVQHDVGLGVEKAPVPVGVFVQRREGGNGGDVRVDEHPVAGLPEPTRATEGHGRANRGGHGLQSALPSQADVSTRRPGRHHQSEGPARLLRAGCLRVWGDAQGPRGEVDPQRARQPAGLVRPRRRRRGVAVRHAHLAVRVLPRRARPGAQAQAAPARPGDRGDLTRHRREGHHARPAAGVLQGRTLQGRDRDRPGQGALRQAPGDRDARRRTATPNAP